LRRVIEDEPQSPRRLRPEVPRDLETIILKAMQKEPGHRYASAAEMANDLDCFLEDRPIRARPPSAAERLTRWSRRHKYIVRSAAACLLLGAVSMAFAWRAESSRREQAVQSAEDLKRQLHASKISLTQGALEHQRAVEAIEHLSACPPELRGWEW